MASRISYAAELAQLPARYEEALAWNLDELRSALLAVASGPALFVGTGGTLAVARLAAGLHERMSGQPARVVTPLELSRLSPMTRSGAVMFSAGLKHPDALMALELLSSGRLRPACVVTFRDRKSIGDMVEADVRIVSLPTLDFEEGFLATTSVLLMFSALLRAYLGDLGLPHELPSPQLELPVDRDRLLILFSPDLAPVSIDIETRCHELGLAAVQATDFRNFAHGRHVGLARHAETTQVIGLVAEPFVGLAMATLGVLPPDKIRVATWQASHDGPGAAIELLVASMRLTGALADAQGVNVARPGAPQFGRRLYHLGLRRLLPKVPDGPVERKLAALASGSVGHELRPMYQQSFGEWTYNLSRSRFGGIILDYDGTVCSTGRRTELPRSEIQQALLRLLDHGVRVGIASGRGKSLHQDLRKWVPPSHWPQLLVGLYNGGALFSLGDDLPDMSRPGALMTQAAERLGELPHAESLVIDVREHQVTVSVRTGTFAQPSRLRELMSAVMARQPPLPVTVVASGHSFDVVPAVSTKRSVADRLVSTCDLPVLAIGDQGDVGGNDFDLLAESPWSLTVDRCSADPTRCWYLDLESRTGPTLLRAYLDAMNLDAPGTFTFDWPRR